MTSRPPPAVNPSGKDSSDGRRSTSLGFLRRSKSTEPLSERRPSGGRISKKKQPELTAEELQRQRDAAAAARQPPKLPGFVPQPQLQTFGGENYHPRMAGGTRDFSHASNGSGIPPVPPIPGNSPEPVDPYARTESMTHRGRYSYASSAVSTLNSPRRVRRRKDPTPYNILIIGAKNSGKTSFLNFLKTSLALPPKKRPIRETDAETPPPSAKANRNYLHHYQETEIDNERIGLTMWDSQGLEKNVVDLQLREMSNFVESKFEDTFIEEMKVVRAPGVRDTHIHCVFLILDPARLDSNIQAVQPNHSNGVTGRFGKPARIVGGLDEDFDLQVLRTLQGKTTVVPVISKADTVTTAHMAFLKKTVWESLKKAGLDPLEALRFGADDDEDDDADTNKLDERDEDEETRQALENGDGDGDGDGEDDAPASPKTEDSDTIPNQPPISHPPRPAMHKRESSTLSPPTSLLDTGLVPLSILSPDSYSLSTLDGPIGRKFPWGFADPYNLEHCDFVKLKDACFGEWRAELREASREIFYERWRTSRLNRQGGNGQARGGTAPEPGTRKSSGGIPAGVLRPKGR